MRLSDEVINALRSGNKIEAIKLLREMQHLGLKEAKDAIDAYVAGHREEIGRVPATAAGARSKPLNFGGVLRLLLVVSAYAWALVNSVDLAGATIVWLNRAGYERAVFMVGNVDHRDDHESGLTWGMHGTVNGVAERLYAPELAETKKPRYSVVKKRYPQGAQVDVLYNPGVTGTLFQKRTLRVVPFTEDLAGAQTKKMMWWLQWCLLPLVIIVILSNVFKDEENA